MNFALIVEGPADQNTYPVLIRRIRGDANLVHPAIPCDSVQRLKGKFVGWLKYLHSRKELQLDKVFVIRDSDCRDPATVENELFGVLQRQELRLGFRVHFHATKCKLETLLLADADAINQAALHRGGSGNIQPLHIPLEEIRDPKPLLRKKLSEARLRVTPQVYGEIAAQINPETLTRNCPHFQQFIAKVQAC